MRPNPPPARSSRTAGAAGALLLQGGFVLLFLYSMPQINRPIETGRELIYVLHRAAPPLTLPPPPPVPGTATIRPAPAPLIPPPDAIVTAPSRALPDFKGFGETLNDCAPERYASLPPEKKMRCPHPGEGIPHQDQQINLSPPSHAKDEARWQEGWDEKHWTAGLCDPREKSVALCQIHQAEAEDERAADVNWHLARDKAASLKPQALPIPRKN